MLDYRFDLPGMATVLERAFVTNKFRLTPSFSALSTSAWCSDLGKRTVNLPEKLMYWSSPPRDALEALALVVCFGAAVLRTSLRVPTAFLATCFAAGFADLAALGLALPPVLRTQGAASGC